MYIYIYMYINLIWFFLSYKKRKRRTVLHELVNTGVMVYVHVRRSATTIAVHRIYLRTYNYTYICICIRLKYGVLYLMGNISMRTE